MSFLSFYNFSRSNYLLALILVLPLFSCSDGDTGSRGDDPDNTNTNTALVLNSHTPLANEIDVPLSSTISVEFNSVLNESSINDTSVKLLAHDNVSIVTDISHSNGTIIITPVSSLEPLTQYTVTLLDTLKNIDNNTLSAEFSWSFITEAANTTTALVINSHTPLANEIDVPLSSSISVVFNSVLNESSINDTSVKLLAHDNVSIVTDISHSNGTIIITPVSSLEPLTQYTVTLLDTLKNIDNNTLSAEFSWGFITEKNITSTAGFCDPLPPASGKTITANTSQASNLNNIVSSLNTGDTLLLEDGTYSLNGIWLWFNTPGVTLRSASGNPEKVILDGGYSTYEIVSIAASNVTIAEITLKRAFTHPVHVSTSDQGGDTLNTLLYRVWIIDPREQAIKINPHKNGYKVDDGEISCSKMLLTDEGRVNVNPVISGCYTGGIDAHKSRDWVVRDNHIEGFWCENGLSEHAIHFWTGSRGTLVERNVLVDNARGIGFGLNESYDNAREYSDNVCPESANIYIDHYEGVIRNNFISADTPVIFNSQSGFDCGICLSSSCNTTVVHNTIMSSGSNYAAIDARFAGTNNNKIINNLMSHSIQIRNGAVDNDLRSNLENISTDIVVDISNADLHLSTPNASQAIDKGVLLDAGMSDFDIDGGLRDNSPDIGADEI